MATLGIRFGALCVPPSDQIKEQLGNVLTDEESKLIDRMSENRIFLGIQGILTDSESRRANTRIMKQVKKMLDEKKVIK